MKKYFLFGQDACDYLNYNGLDELLVNLDGMMFSIKEYNMPQDWKKGMEDTLGYNNMMEISEDVFYAIKEVVDDLNL